MQTITSIEKYLANFTERCLKVSQVDKFRDVLLKLKEEAVRNNDEMLAKKLWCYEVIHTIQIRFVEAYNCMQSRHFYAAWNYLEGIEVNLHFLERHFDFHSFSDDRYGLRFIKRHTEQFQQLYPYKMFISPGYLILKKSCTICGKEVSVRRPCGHVVGEIYGGEMCSRRIDEAALLETSFVTNPVQKSSVLFLVNPATGRAENHYNYWLVDYVTRGLRHPFVKWDYEVLTLQRPVKSFGYLDPDTNCPCGSGKTFKSCCVTRDYVEVKHYQIKFSEDPPQGVVPYLENAYVQDEGTLFIPKDNSPEFPLGIKHDTV
jgi:hypothetical protein